MGTFRKGRPALAVVDQMVASVVLEPEPQCYCPDDCACHHSWRQTVCGCKAHPEAVVVPERVSRISQPLSPATEAKARETVLGTVRKLPAEVASAVPYNRTTGEAYKGKNVMRLLMSEAEHGWETAAGWAGFRQWVDHGRVVAKGEKSTAIMTVFTGTDGEKHVGGKRVFHFSQTVELDAG